MKKKRVLILEQQSFRGGAQRVLEVVLDGLRNRIDPIVALPESGPFQQDLRSKGVETMIYPLGRYLSGRKSIADIIAFGPRSLYAAGHLVRTIVRRKVDMVMINGPRSILAGAMAARSSGRPCLFCLHNTLSRRLDVALAARASGLASRIVACSRAAAGPLLKNNPALKDKLRVLYPPVPRLLDQPVRNRRGGSPFVVGMVGRITEGKGHQILIDALARLGPSAGIRLLIVGAPAPGSAQDATHLRSLQASAQRAGLDHLVDWAGYQPDPAPYYSAMDVLTLPSTVEEGMPVVVLEAFQRALPVIASRSGGIPEIVEAGVNGILTTPGDPAGLAGAIATLHNDRDLYDRLGSAARASVDARFSPESYCYALDQLVSELCPPDAALERAGSGPV